MLSTTTTTTPKPATYKPFNEAAKAYELVRTYIRDNHSTAANPINTTNLIKALENNPLVKGPQQIKDAIKKYRANKDFACMREGLHLMIWWRGEATGSNHQRGRKLGSKNKPKEIKSLMAETPVLNKTDENQTINEIAASDWGSVDKVTELTQPTPVETDLPQVTITKTAIHILAGGVKISIER